MRAALVLSTLLAWLLAGCLRLIDEPDAWPCTTNADCDDGGVCRSERCVPAGTCLGDLECAAGQACLAGRCAKVECVRDGTPCGAYVCLNHACLASCSDEHQCAPGYGCRDGGCAPAECSPDRSQDCGPYACAQLICRTSCSGDGDCDTTFRCLDGACVPRLKGLYDACSSDTECETNTCCPIAFGQAAHCNSSCQRAQDGQACETHLDCTSRSCVEGKCAACRDAACLTELCGNAECGMRNFVECGGCDLPERCVDNQCTDPCRNVECGYGEANWYCPCEGLAYCDNAASQCVAACVDQECGLDHGVACGDCPAKSYCTSQNLCQFDCGARECGLSPNAADCGRCDDGKLCDDGACVTPVCDPRYGSFCKDDQPWLCLDGLDAEPSLATCALDQFCFESFDEVVPRLSGARCVTKPCKPREMYCSNEGLYAECDELGHGPQPGGRDCMGETLLCTLSGCASQVSSAGVGSCDEQTNAVAFGNVYKFSASTTLLSFDAALDVRSAGRWLVYRAASLDGPFQMIFNGVDDTFAVTVGKSPHIGLELETGVYYLLVAMRADDASTVFCSSSVTTSTIDDGNVIATYLSLSAPPDHISGGDLGQHGLAVQWLNRAVLSP